MTKYSYNGVVLNKNEWNATNNYAQRRNSEEE